MFSPRVQCLLVDPDTVRLVSPISFIEIAIKANRGLTQFTRQHLQTLVFDLDLTVLPISAEHSMGLFGLPAHHHDPFDRALISIALAESVPLVARDREFKKYKRLRTMW
jgi:PIN domain nuclease of toxin-antitoxin system